MQKIRYLFIISTVIFWMISCTSDREYRKIDFSKTVEMPKPEEKQQDSGELRVAVAAMISPKETFVYYKAIMDYLGGKIGMDIRMVQKKTYEEINELFPKNEVDLAFICSGPYALQKEKYQFEAIATPVVRGSPYYQSYLIVNKKSDIETLEDLKHRSFAFSDPDSNTGSLVPNYWLFKKGKKPETFFNRTHYTYSHDNSILAVAKSLVDGAAVDGHKWEYFQLRNNIHTSKTRVIKKSEKFGSPPIVTSNRMDKDLKKRIKGILFSMHETEEGKIILDNLLIDRFIEPKEEWYTPIRSMRNAIADLNT